MADIMQVTDPGCCGMRRVDEDGCCVGCGRDFFDPDTGEERGDGTRVANPRLSSAAFDMLKALEAVCESGASMDINVVEQVWAAIAKARDL